MKKFKIKTGDQVVIIAGDHKGFDGKVLSIDKVKGRVVVEGVNMVKKHKKPSANNPQGGIQEMEAPLAISNVSLIEKGKPVKVAYQVKDNKKVRVSRKTGEII